MPRDEFKFLKSILKNYHDYVVNKNPETLISKIYGIHKVIFYRKKHKMSKKLYFVIMDNVFRTRHMIDHRYDLKGSTFGRRTIKKDGPKPDRTVALKDLDFLEREDVFRVGKENYKRIIDIIR